MKSSINVDGPGPADLKEAEKRAEEAARAERRRRFDQQQRTGQPQPAKAPLPVGKAVRPAPAKEADEPNQPELFENEVEQQSQKEPEDKGAKFRVTAARRVRAVLHGLQLVGQCTGRGYTHTPAQARLVIGTLRRAVDALEAKFAGREKTKEEFSFDGAGADGEEAP